MRKKKTLQLPLGKAVLALSAFLIVALSSARADEPCTLTTITGPYVIGTLGQEAAGYATTLFEITSDGNGHLSGTGAESLNGTFSSQMSLRPERYRNFELPVHCDHDRLAGQYP